MSIVGELTFFLGLQIKQLENGIFLSQSKYIRELVCKKFGLESTKHFKTPMFLFLLGRRSSRTLDCHVKTLLIFENPPNHLVFPHKLKQNSSTT